MPSNVRSLDTVISLFIADAANSMSLLFNTFIGIFFKDNI